MSFDVEGFVLTGGASIRMGKDKSRLSIGGETLAERAIRNLTAVCSKVTTVGGNRVGAVPRVEDVIEPEGHGQKAAIIGVFSALKHANSEWTAILACDLPFVPPDLFRVLISEAKAAPKVINIIVPIQPDGRFQPLCALYRTKPIFSAVEAAIREGSLKLTDLLEQIDLIAIDFSKLDAFENAKDQFVNINTLEDLAHAREVLRSS
jgi:molybdopterin-guanine dinucleotide biosynthesis protein A